MATSVFYNIILKLHSFCGWQADCLQFGDSFDFKLRPVLQYKPGHLFQESLMEEPAQIRLTQTVKGAG
jgi:hypothetical protein